MSLVARRYDVNANQVFAWRRRYRAGSAEPAGLQLMPVTVTPDQPTEAAPARGSELIEIELAGGYRVRIGSGVKASISTPDPGNSAIDRFCALGKALTM